MTGLKQIENQRAFEKAHKEAKQEPSYKLLQEIYKRDNITDIDLKERARVYLDTGVLTNQYVSQ